jgi:hypothetical protein
MCHQALQASDTHVGNTDGLIVVVATGIDVIEREILVTGSVTTAPPSLSTTERTEVKVAVLVLNRVPTSSGDRTLGTGFNVRPGTWMQVETY